MWSDAAENMFVNFESWRYLGIFGDVWGYLGIFGDVLRIILGYFEDILELVCGCNHSIVQMRRPSRI